MKIEYFSSPVPFYIIREYLTKDEYSFYFKQIQKLKPMLKREGTGGAVDLEGGLKKQNQGVWIDSQHPITKLNDKLFGPVSWETRNDWFYRMLTKKMNYSILLNYYEDGDYYLPHIDDSIITTILYLWEEPKTFTGGELCFGEFVVPIENNSMVIFPSMTEHSVNRLEGYGRWAITNFLHEHIEPPVRNKLNVLNVSAYRKVQDFIKKEKWEFMGNHWKIDLNNIELFNKTILEAIYEIIGTRLQVKDVHARGQLYGQNIETRTDGTTFILHTNDINDEDITLWEGKTASQNPYQNSGVIIKNDVEYRSMCPSRLVNDLKVTIVWVFY